MISASSLGPTYPPIWYIARSGRTNSSLLMPWPAFLAAIESRTSWAISSSLAPLRSSSRASHSTVENRQFLTLPSAVIRRRLQSPQKGCVTGLMKPMRPRPSAKMKSVAGWLGSFTRYKAQKGGTDLPNWLEMHRAGTVIVDRKTAERQTLFISRAAVSVTGGIQPGVLARALSPEFLDAGLAARLLMAMPPKLPKRWS